MQPEILPRSEEPRQDTTPEKEQPSQSEQPWKYTPGQERLSRAEQSRVNGAKSHGPVTIEGKAISSRNAEKLGVYSQNILLYCENKDRFEAFTADLCGRFQPVGEVELMLLGQMAGALWQRQRFELINKTIVEIKLSRIDPKSHQVSAPEDAEHLAIVYMRDGEDSAQTLDRLARHVERAERAYNRAVKHLAALQAQRLGPQNANCNNEPGKAPQKAPKPVQPPPENRKIVELIAKLEKSFGTTGKKEVKTPEKAAAKAA
jgi:hypothetical protein